MHVCEDDSGNLISKRPHRLSVFTWMEFVCRPDCVVLIVAVMAVASVNWTKAHPQAGRRLACHPNAAHLTKVS